MTFKDLGDWAELSALKLPIGGKVYTIPPADAELGRSAQALVAVGGRIAQGGELDDHDRQVLGEAGDEIALYQRLLGPVYDEMSADGVPWRALKHAAMTALIDNAVDRDNAERFWATLGKTTAKKPGKPPADRKPAKGSGKRTAR